MITRRSTQTTPVAGATQATPAAAAAPVAATTSSTGVPQGRPSKFTAEDDTKLLDAVNDDKYLTEKIGKDGNPTIKWNDISNDIFESRVTGAYLRARYTNVLHPSLKKGKWENAEIQQLIALHNQHGDDWNAISAAFGNARAANVCRMKWQALQGAPRKKSTSAAASASGTTKRGRGRPRTEVVNDNVGEEDDEEEMADGGAAVEVEETKPVARGRGRKRRKVSGGEAGSVQPVAPVHGQSSLPGITQGAHADALLELTRTQPTTGAQAAATASLPATANGRA